jgi:osmotically-inducible protein OsmY
MVMSEVTKRVRAEIESEPIIRRCQIAVECEKGMVLLLGQVGTFYQKQVAQEAARRVIDKKIPYLALTVQNDLRVS